MTPKNWLFAASALIAIGCALALIMVQRGEAPGTRGADTQEIPASTSSPSTVPPTPAHSGRGSETTSPATVVANPFSQPSQIAAIPLVKHPASATTGTIVYQPPAQSPQQVAAALHKTIAKARSTDTSAGSASSQSSISGDAPTPSSPPAGSFVAPTSGIAPASQQSLIPQGAPAASSENLTGDSPVDVLEIQVPPGARLPAALADGPQDQDLSPAQLALKETVAQDFLNQTATATPDGSDVAAWNRLANEADERLRKMIGHDAFNRMALSASQEAVGQQLPPTPPASTTPPEEPEVVTNPAPISSP